MTDDRPAHLLPNRPELREEVALELREKLLPLEARKAQILERLPKVVVTDNASAGAASDFVAIAETLLSDVDDARKAVKRPLDAAIDVVQARAGKFAEPIEDAASKVRARIRKFRAEARERAARAAEEQAAEEARLRAEAEARERGQLAVEPVPAPEPVPVAEISLPVARGDYGSKVRDKREKVWKITDPRQLPDTILNSPKVQEAMLAAVKRLGSLQEQIPGARFEWAVGDAIRKGGR